jgi:hypothetical protein
MCQLSRVWNLGAGDRPNLLGRHGNDSRRLAGESNEFDLVSLVAWVDVNDCSNVTRLKPLLGKMRGQNDSIVFVNHVGNLL